VRKRCARLITDSRRTSSNPAATKPAVTRSLYRAPVTAEPYDVVVIGSGYGGGVAASRMARGKQSVCVLERGKERWPGEFPEKLEDAVKEVHVSGEFAPGDRRSVPGTAVEKGNPTGLYHWVVGDGQNVFMGKGLGGTSLLNANVFLEAHPKILDMKIWPEELRGREAWRKCE
jgi:choline dehydrogenase-like flavoprotein